MAYNFTVTTYLSQVNITPNAQGQFVIQSTATNINVSTQGTLVQFTRQPATTSTLGAVKIGSGISVSEDGTISIGADDDSSYVTQTVFSNTNVSFFNNDAAYITLADVPPTNQLSSSTGGTVTLNGGGYPTLELSSSTYIVFDSPDANGEAFLIGLLTAGEEDANTGSFLLSQGAPLHIGVDANRWYYNQDGSLTIPNGSPINFGNGNSHIQAGMGFHISSQEGVSLDAVDATDPDNLIYKNWYFSPTGEITFPDSTLQSTAFTATLITDQLGDIRFQGSWIKSNTGGDIYISPQDGNTWIYLPEDNINSTTAVSIANYAGGGVQIQTPSATYAFNTNGITFPDTSVQTTAYTGTNNLFDQGLNTTDSVTFANVTGTNVIQASQFRASVGANYGTGYSFYTETDQSTGVYSEFEGQVSIYGFENPIASFNTNTVTFFTATSGINYNDLNNLPVIPTALSSLTNDVGYLTSSTVAQYIPPAYDQSLNTTDSPTFANLNILGTMTVVNTTVTNEIVVNKETITDTLTFGDGSTQTTAAFNYSLPTASTSTLGGVKLAWPQAGIGIDESGALQIKLNPIGGTGTNASAVWNESTKFFDLAWNLNIASTSTLGGIKIDTVEPVIVADSQGHLDLNWQFQSGTGTQWAGAWDPVQGLYTAKTNLLPATTSTIGGVKGGANILIDSNGTIRQQYSTVYSSGLTFSDSAANSSTGVITRTLSVLIATTSSLGGIKVGSGLSINSSTGVLSVSFPSYVTSGSNISIFNNDSGYLTSSTLSSYLPADVDNYLVGASGGTGISVSTAAQIATISLNTATTATLGGVKGGANILIDTTGTIRQQYSTSYGSGLTSSDSAANTVTGVITRTASVLIATTSTLGGIKVGSGLSINSSTGVLSVSFPSYVTSGSNISIFNNDSGYITTSSLAGYSTATAVSELTNDAGYITSSSVPAQGSTAVYARNELPGGTIGMIITISDSGTDTNAPAGNWAPAYWDNDAELWVYIGNSNSVTPV